MAESGSWPSIREHGLLSTTALLTLYEVPESKRTSIELSHRPESVKIEHPRFGTAVVRDQKPLSEEKLRSCLIEMEPTDWYRLLNSRVFFWPTKGRLLRLLNARAYRDTKHTIITVDTAKLVDRHFERITLSPINSGSTIIIAVPRGLATFASPSRFPDTWWRKRRLAEIAVENGIQDIADLVLSVEEWQGVDKLSEIYRR
jgi:hypothetical protein